MSTTTATRALTLRDVARPDVHDEASAQLGRHIDDVVAEAGGRNRLDGVAQHSLDTQIRALLDSALDRDVVGVLGAAWQVSERLRAAGYATAAAPGTRQIVRLASQTCSHTVKPTVVIRLDALLIATVEVVIVAELTFADLAVAISAGAVVAFEFGQCDITVSISSAAQIPPLLQRSMTLTANAELPLTQPIPLPRQHPHRQR